MALVASGVAAEAPPLYSPAEILVRWKEGAAKPAGAALAALEALRNRYGVVAETRLVLEKNRNGSAKFAAAPALFRWAHLQLNSAEDPQIVARDFAALELVEHAQPNFLRRETTWPSDSLFAQQWNLEAIGWNWNTVENAAGIVVGLIDSGVDFEHPDIASQIWNNAGEVGGVAGIDDDGNGYVDDFIGWDFSHAPGLPGQGDYLHRDNQPWDESGHGTHVAGIIAATVDNGVGIAGVAQGVSIMPLRAGFNLPGGSFLEDDDIAAAIIYAVENGADILNMSWGSPHFSPLLRDAVRFADQAGCIMVAAAGNEGGGAVFIPARFDETIAVAATDLQNRILSFSIPGYSIDLAAPGQNILSLEPGGGYVLRSGTSMAAPHVAGLAALVLARSPHFNPNAVRGVMLASARDIGAPGWDFRAGEGVVQMDALHLDGAPVVRLEVGGDSAVVDEEGEVRLELGGAGFESCEISWGVGANPQDWHLLQKAAVKTQGVYKVSWDTSVLLPGQYLVRARVRWRGHWLEERISVQVAHEGPTIHNLRLGRVLNGSVWGYQVKWETDLQALGKVNLFRAGSEDILYEVAGALERRGQRVLLPPQLVPGDYDLEVEARTGKNLSTISARAGFTVRPQAFSKWQFEEFARYPDGYLLGQFSDLNENGIGELVQMGYGGRHYNPIDLYEFQEGAAAKIHSSSHLYIPWSVHDLDGDGRSEIMAVDAQRVRLLEALQRGGFPERVKWERRDVWGGEIGDLDGDGLAEMYLRSSRSNFFRVFENNGDDRFEEITTVANPTLGSNDLGERQLVADFDGDGQGEFLAGDGDGDIFIFESIADNALRETWREAGAVAADARIVGGGGDLDSDGRVEFIVARLFRDSFAPAETFWEVAVYQPAADNHFRREWGVEVLGGKLGGNGISIADLDGDGEVEFILALVPNLYVFRATGEDEYQPVWHLETGDTFRPAVGNLDGTGNAALAFNHAGGVGAFRFEEIPAGLVAPGGFSGFALDEARIRLEWDAVGGAGAYRVYRNGEFRAGPLSQTTFDDVGLEAGKDYYYSVAALDFDLDREGMRTNPILLIAEPPPRILQVKQLSRHQIALIFNSSMDVSHEETFLYKAEDGLGIPASVFADKNSHRVVLSFGSALPDSGVVVLRIGDLRNLRGAPLDADSRRVELELEFMGEQTGIVGVEVISATRVLLEFERKVMLPADSKRTFAFENSRILMRRVLQAELNKVLLVLEEETPLLALGQPYWIRIRGLLDDRGKPFDARVSFSYAAEDLHSLKVFPNPFFPGRGGLVFAGLTPESRVGIYDLAGQLVRQLIEENSDGGLRWDGLNSAGRPVHTGMYLYRVENKTQVRRGKFVLIRR